MHRPVNCRVEHAVRVVVGGNGLLRSGAVLSTTLSGRRQGELGFELGPKGSM